MRCPSLLPPDPPLVTAPTAIKAAYPQPTQQRRLHSWNPSASVALTKTTAGRRLDLTDWDIAEFLHYLARTRSSAQGGDPILTIYDIDEAVYAALRAGASGFLKDASLTEIVAAIRAVAAGKAWLDPAITRRLIDEFTARPEQHKPTSAEMVQLTPREREVLILLA